MSTIIIIIIKQTNYAVFIYHLVTHYLPGALMETSKHQQLSLAEDHPVAAAT